MRINSGVQNISKSGDCSESKLRAGLAFNFRNGFVWGRRFFVRPVVGNRIEHISDGDDACFQRNRFFTQAGRITAAIPALVM